MNQAVHTVLTKEMHKVQIQLSQIRLRNPRAPLEMDTVLRVALAEPNLRFGQIADRCSEDLGWRISIWPGKVLRTCGAEDAPERVLLADLLKHSHKLMSTIIRSENQQVLERAVEKLFEIIDSKNHYSLIPGLARCLFLAQRDVLITSTDPMERDLGQKFTELLKVMLVSQTAPIFRNILSALSLVQSRPSENSLAARVSGMIEQAARVSEDAPLANMQTAVDAEAFAEENADLRAALFGLRNELEALQEQIRTMQTVSAENATARFLADLNTSAAGHLLDNIVFSSRAIRALENTGWIPEPIEVEGIVATITMLSDHLTRLGVEPIFDVGAQTEITMEDLSEIQYVGSEFAGPTDLKIVRFKSPGWRYRNQRIARAQAVEIAPNPPHSNA